MYISHNIVAIYPDAHFTKDGHFDIFSVFDPERHFSVKGRVIIPPKDILYTRNEMEVLRMKYKKEDVTINRRVQLLASMSVDYDTGVEIKCGDEVYFNFLNHTEAAEEEMVIDVGLNRKILLVSYDTLYMAKRQKETIMLNGNILVEPIDYTKDQLIKLGGGFEKVMDNNKMPGKGIVRYAGVPNGGYMFSNKNDTTDVKIGDVVYFRHSNDVPMEWSYHKTIDKDKKYPYFRMQRKDILAIE